MGNFGRVVRLSLKYRFTFIASILSALVVGVLWGGNLSALYPLVVICGRNQPLQEWCAEQITASQQKIAECEAFIAEAERESETAAIDGQAELQAQIARKETDKNAEQGALARYRRIQPYLEAYVPRQPFPTLLMVVALLLAGTLIKSVFLIAHTVLVARLSYLGGFQLQKRFFARTLRMDIATFNNDGTSDLMSRFTHDMQNLTGGLSVLFGKLVREPMKMIVCFVGAGIVCWRLLLLTLLVAPAAVLLIRGLARSLKRANRRAMEEMSQLYGTLGETLQGIKIVKAFTMERHERQRFHRTAKQYFRRAMKIARYDGLSRSTIEVMGMLMIFLGMMAGAYLVLQHQTHLLGIRLAMRPMNLESLLVFFGLLSGAADPARKLSDVFTQLQAGTAAADRIYAMLDREPSVRDPQSPLALPRHAQDIVFDGVRFGYQPGYPVLHDINLRIRFGETLAIVGPSGCGKTTLANLIPRFADPTQGEIRLDGFPLREVRLLDLRRQIGLVTQDPLLFDDTVCNNIRYGSPQATVEEVVDAANQAHAHRFIEDELPDGYDTIVGPQGSQVSGGQRQRISLARAILRDPSILILDEATSQVDLESEKLIQKVLEKFVRGRTVVIITHRLSALVLADRIAVMQDGRILDLGTHHELIARCDLYRRLYEIQFEDLKQSA
ncbi:MAG: ABC transporter ATP-binding protein [Thermoguttaceae bacterium]